MGHAMPWRCSISKCGKGIMSWPSFLEGLQASVFRILGPQSLNKNDVPKPPATAPRALLVEQDLDSWQPLLAESLPLH